MKNIKDYYKIYKSAVIGKGGYAIVYCGKNRATQQKVAIKVFHKPSMKESDIAGARKEAELLGGL